MPTDPYKETFNSWDQVADLYQQKFMDLSLYDHTYDAFCAHLAAQHPKILEAGCGPGNITRYLLTKRPDLDIQGIDISPNMIRLARQNNPAASFRVMDARRIKDLATTYDAIVAGFCIPYFSPADTSEFMEACRKMLPENGLLYLSFVEGNTENSGFKTGSSGHRTYFYYHSLQTMILELKKNNFKIIESWQVNYPVAADPEFHTVLLTQRGF